jgi:hypothetical protein
MPSVWRLASRHDRSLEAHLKLGDSIVALDCSSPTACGLLTMKTAFYADCGCCVVNPFVHACVDVESVKPTVACCEYFESLGLKILLQEIYFGVMCVWAAAVVSSLPGLSLMSAQPVAKSLVQMPRPDVCVFHA